MATLLPHIFDIFWQGASENIEAEAFSSSLLVVIYIMRDKICERRRVFGVCEVIVEHVLRSLQSLFGLSAEVWFCGGPTHYLYRHQELCGDEDGIVQRIELLGRPHVLDAHPLIFRTGAVHGAC